MAVAGSKQPGSEPDAIAYIKKVHIVEQTFVLSYPPSSNNLFFNLPSKGRVRTPKYIAWINTAGWELQSQRPKPMPGKVKIIIRAVRPDKKKRDIANLEKPITDLLVSHRIISDDSLVESLLMEWTSDNLTGVSVTIVSLETPS